PDFTLRTREERSLETLAFALLRKGIRKIDRPTHFSSALRSTARWFQPVGRCGNGLSEPGRTSIRHFDEINIGNE
ncbi:MAG: hypothetical protein R3E68_16525, partial [Burkholderiaceae bacterium]